MLERIQAVDKTRRRFLTAVSGVVVGMTSSTAAQQTTTRHRHQNGGHRMCCFRFGGRTSGWQGRGPQSIAGQQNPRLQLEPGRTYGVMWENLDGQPHTFALRDSNGENLAVILPNVQTMQGPMRGGNQTMMGGNQTMMGGQNGTMMGGQNGSMMGGHQGQGRQTPPENAIKVTPQVAKKGTVQMLMFIATRDIAQYLCTVHPTTMVGDVTMKSSHGDGGQGDGNG